MWYLPQYRVTFGEKVELNCAGYDEVTHLVPILLRSGYGSFRVDQIDDIEFPDKQEESVENI